MQVGCKPLCCAVLSHAQLFATPWTGARQGPLSMEFSRQEYWSEYPFSPPGHLSDLGTQLVSLTSHALKDGFTTSTAWEASRRKASLTGNQTWAAAVRVLNANH